MNNWLVKILLLFFVNTVNQLFSQNNTLNYIDQLTKDFKTQYSINANLAKTIAVKAYRASLNLNIPKKDSVIGECSKNLGVAYEVVGMYDSAVWYFIEAEKKADITKNIDLKQKVLNNLGIIYYTNKEYQKAKENFKTSSILSLQDDDIENAYLSLKNILAISIQTEDRDLFWNTLTYTDSICTTYKRSDLLYDLEDTKIIFLANDNPEDAIEYLKSKIIECKKSNVFNSLDLALSFRNLAKVYLSIEKPELAISNLDSSIHYSVLSGSLLDQKKSLNLKIQADIELYLKDAALNDFKKLNNLLDTIAKSSNERAIAEMQTKYDTEKKEKENELLKKEKQLSELENETRKKQTRYLAIGLSIAFILLIVILNRFMLTRKQKQKIEKQKEIIEEEKKAVEVQKQKTEEQKLIIEEKNHEIMASINYAKKIQTAVLKEEQHVSPTFPEHFILYIPKDVVSGDFYWALEKGDYIYITAADCTGHGVPGAFMSMLGISFLNEINNTEKVLSPAQILDDLRLRIIKELGQTGAIEGSKDGMDISMVRLNLKTNEIAWAGANNPLYIIKNNQLIEVRGDRQPVGYSYQQEPFTDHRLELKKGMVLYLFSDGFHDQFGGSKGKKYKTKQLKNKFLEIHKEPLLEQKNILHKEFLTWRGDIEQIDDVCVIGLKL